ncbi:uncharacterized protein LOC117329528 [Pecten maximus]|uniref:uncharacterized protein LOC117329528 n=1 Tax=Pecten maximus TaxID=6579 RepID=UPI001458B423|nr:uncharacterized protein LOC117329528 [Pecten maximus]
MSVYSAYLPRSSAKSDKTSTRFRKPTFGSPLYRDAGRVDDTRTKRPGKQNGRLVKNGLHGMEDETEISYPVQQTSLPDIRKDVFQPNMYGGPEEGLVFQDLAVGATDNYKLLVKNMKRGEKHLMSKSPPGKGQGQIMHVRSSPSERQSVRNKSNSPPVKQHFHGSDNKTSNRDPNYNGNQSGHDRFVWTNEDDEQEFQDPDFAALGNRYGGHPTGPQVYGTVHVDGNTRPPRRKATVHRTSSFGSSSSKTLQSQQNLHITSEKGSNVINQTQPTNNLSGKLSNVQEGGGDKVHDTRERHLVDISTNTENTEKRIMMTTVRTGVSIGIQTEQENTSTSNVRRQDSPIPANDSHRKLDPWKHPLLNYEFYGSSDMKKSTSVPTVISGYEMAKYNPPNIESSKHHDRIVRRLGLTSNDMVWCIEPNARGPKRSATYNLGSIMTKNNSHRLGRGKSRTRIVTPWK